MKTLGTAVPILLTITTACWLYMIRLISLWVGKAGVPGRETDKIMQQVWAAVAALVIWILLGGLLLLAGVKGVMPERVGFVSWFLVPVACFASLAGIGLAYDLETRWTVGVPIITPMLVGGYVVYTFFPSAQVLAPGRAGFIMWAVVVVLGLSLIPAFDRFYEAHRSDSVEATPGPELDRFLARERERRRQDGLEELRKIDEQSSLRELEHLIRDDSPVRAETIEAMRHLPERQANAEEAFIYDYNWIFGFLSEIDVQPTPRLCTVAGESLRRYVAFWRKQFPEGTDSMGPVLESGVKSIGWLAANCPFDAELDLLEQLASEQRDVRAVQDFREAIAGFHKKAAQ